MMLDGMAHFREDTIAEQVSEIIIDGLESIGIEQQHHGGVVLGREHREAGLHMADGAILREEPGEAIVIGPLLQTVLPELLRLYAAQFPKGYHGARPLEIRQQMHLCPEVFILVVTDAQFVARLADGIVRRCLLLE